MSREGGKGGPVVREVGGRGGSEELARWVRCEDRGEGE